MRGRLSLLLGMSPSEARVNVGPADETGCDRPCPSGIPDADCCARALRATPPPAPNAWQAPARAHGVHAPRAGQPETVRCGTYRGAVSCTQRGRRRRRTARSARDFRGRSRTGRGGSGTMRGPSRPGRDQHARRSRARARTSTILRRIRRIWRVTGRSIRRRRPRGVGGVADARSRRGARGLGARGLAARGPSSSAAARRGPRAFFLSRFFLRRRRQRVFLEPGSAFASRVGRLRRTVAVDDPRIGARGGRQ